MKLIEPKLSYIEKTTFDECLKEMKFQDIHIDENYEREINLVSDLRLKRYIQKKT